MRLYFIDNMKAIGIILVVLGHAKWLNEDIVKFIYSFHMPLFFFLSGYLACAIPVSTRSNLIAVTKRLLIPFVFFFLLSYILWLPLSLFGAGQASQILWYGPIIDFIFSYSTSFHINGVLWFFPSLIVVVLIDRLILCRLHNLLALAISLVVSVFFVFEFSTWKIALVWSIDTALVALFFYMLGKTVSKYGFFINEVVSFKSTSIIAIFTGASLFILMNLSDGKLDLRSLAFGDIPLFYYVNAILGICLVFCLSYMLPQNKMLTVIAMSTLTIFPIHSILFRFLTKFETSLMIHFNDVFIALLPLINTVVAIITCLLIHHLLSKYLPWSIGLSHKKSKM
jgi:acyltransferase